MGQHRHRTRLSVRFWQRRTWLSHHIAWDCASEKLCGPHFVSFGGPEGRAEERAGITGEAAEHHQAPDSFPPDKEDGLEAVSPACNVATTMPLGTELKTCGGMIEPGTSPAVPPAAMSGAMSFAPLEFLITLLINISRMDSDGFFEEPVREEDAPGYYDVIKQPMCFQRMKEKVRWFTAAINALWRHDVACMPGVWVLELVKEVLV